ncbi:MAG: hypothetical protein JW726_00285 [Anaerolineales bacterium]|nr:hypothetical protein [Anaerolineales bacterium]
MAEKDCYLGVDVGSSKCHALLADAEGHALGFGQAGPGNHEVVGYGGLRLALKKVVSQALRMAGRRIDQVCGAGFGVSGYDWPSERAPTLAAIQTLGLGAPVEAVNDTLIGLLAGASQGWGVAVVAGTGANCWGWDPQRRVGRMIGHQGFGEYGGAGSLVERAMQMVAYEWTQRGPATQLTHAFVALTGAQDLADMLEGLSMDRYHVDASAARLVFQIAEQGDLPAQQTIRWAGEELGNMALGVIRQLQFEDLDFEVVLVGSLYEGGARLINPMREMIQKEAPGARLVRLQAPPVVGGVLLGMEQAGLDAPKVRKTLIQATRELLENLPA